MAYINREKFIKKCAKTFGNPSMTLYAINNIANECVSDVEEVKHSRWEKVSEKSPRYVCTNCRHLFNNKGYKRCPECGTKMDGGKNENLL